MTSSGAAAQTGDFHAKGGAIVSKLRALLTFQWPEKAPTGTPLPRHGKVIMSGCTYSLLNGNVGQ